MCASVVFTLFCSDKDLNRIFYLSKNSENKSEYMSGAEAVAQRCSVKKGVLRNFAKLTGKRLCQNLQLY